MGAGFHRTKPPLLACRFLLIRPANTADFFPVNLGQCRLRDNSPAIFASLALGLVRFLVQLVAGVAPVSSAVSKPPMSSQVLPALAANFRLWCIRFFNKRIPARRLPVLRSAEFRILCPARACPSRIGGIPTDDSPAFWANKFRRHGQAIPYLTSSSFYALSGGFISTHLINRPAMER
jgi:hypothetical protein